MGPMNGLIMSGVALAALGLISLAIPVFTTQQTKEVAKIGNLKLQTTENTAHGIVNIKQVEAVFGSNPTRLGHWNRIAWL
jgi:uncharacterized membrane protein